VQNQTDNHAHNERHFELLINAVIDYAIYMISPEGKVLSWNSGASRLKGYSAGEIIGKPFSNFYTPEDQASGLPARALQIAGKEGRFHAEGWRVRKDGRKFWASVVIDAIRDEQGKLLGFAKVTRDVTERQAAHEAVVESERKYRRLIDAVVDYAIYQIDVSGLVATWNAGAERIKGYIEQEIIGQHFSRFYTEEDRAAGMPERALAIASENGRYEAEGWRVRKDNSKFWALVVIDAIYDDAKILIGFAKVTRDITERHDALVALKATQEQLAASQKMEAVGQLSGGIAHDFNNLMMIVLGNLEAAARHARQMSDATNMLRALANATRGAQRAAALTSRLLAFSRRQPLDPKPIDVTQFITGSVEFLQRSLGETVQIEAVGSAGLWRIEADPNHLESALVNLAINARDAMPKGGKLTIEAANIYADEEYVRANPEVNTGQYVVICVTDTGSGMTKDILDRAFEPFFTTKEVGLGTGLGLSQVYGFVKQSGGHVKIYSESGSGTTIKMYFPRMMRIDEALTEEAENLTAEAEANETILVVEDDTDVRTYLAETLRALKYSVVTASGTQNALMILVQDVYRIDLMLTDVVMPGLNGRELGRRAQALRPGLPVLYMTGYSRNAVVHQGRLDEGVELLQKPVSEQQLASRIRAMLDNART
jgi:PAS domain S-box-containing protein